MKTFITALLCMLLCVPAFADQQTTVLSSPVNIKKATGFLPFIDGSNDPVLEKEANNIMKSRMRKILNCFIVSDCTDIILGAFGCGVFGNSAEKIAIFWKELLYDEGYIYYFNNICFSVLDTNATKNYDIFCEVLQNTK